VVASYEGLPKMNQSQKCFEGGETCPILKLYQTACYMYMHGILFFTQKCFVLQSYIVQLYIILCTINVIGFLVKSKKRRKKKGFSHHRWPHKKKPLSAFCRHIRTRGSGS
jgi:hypothetical protein